MIERANNTDDVKKMIKYIGKNYKAIPYLYVNLKQYGIGTNDVTPWIDYKNDGQINGVYLKYYDCVHFFTNEANAYSAEEFVDFVNNCSHKVLMLQADFGNRIDCYFSDYYSERNYVIDMDNVGIDNNNYISMIAERSDIKEIVD